MKKFCFISFLLFGTTCFATPLSDVEKRAFLDFYRANTELGTFPLEEQTIFAFFFDLNNDGLEDAILIDILQLKECYAWDVLIQTPTTWEWAKLRYISEFTVDPISSIQAEFHEFHVLTRENELPQLVYISSYCNKFNYDENEEGNRTYYVTNSIYSISVDEEGYVKVPLNKHYPEEIQAEVFDQLFGKGTYTLEPISIETYTVVPAVKPEERTQLANPETPQSTALKNAEKEVTLETSETEDVPAPLQNEKPTFIKKWLPVFIVLVLYAVWRVTRHRFQNKTRHPQPPAI